MKLFTIEQIREWDLYTIENEPISSTELMERASRNAAQWIIEKYPESKNILILVGNGNNGGDGLAMGRILFKKGYNVDLLCLNKGQRTNDNLINYNLSKNLNINILNTFIKSDYSIIIDAIFGSGLSRNIQGDIKEIILEVNKIKGTKISIDCPSGIHADNGPLPEAIFRADFTLTFQRPKIAFYFRESSEFIGDVQIIDIGLSEKYLENEASNFFLIDHEMTQLSKRKKFSHKGTYGHTLLIAGEMGKMGACWLSAKASLRSGSGLTTVLAPSDTQEILQSSLPEAMTVCYQDNDQWINLVDINKFSSIGIGPGIGNHSVRAKQLLEFIPFINQPIIIDADALNILAANNSLHLIPKYSILTPHPGEFKRLFGKRNSTKEYIELQKEISKKYQIIIVHKLAHTIITDMNGKVYFNNTGNPGMATGGSGDVLTGVICGLLAQGKSPLESAIMGVFHHGLAGDKCKDLRSETNMIASDLIENLFIDD